MTHPIRQIIALGGGGFSMEPDNPALDCYVLEQAGNERPKICFIPTASGDSDTYIANFYTAFARYECRPSHLQLFRRTPDLESLLLSQDILYVGGGNTRSMLAVWREWGLPAIFKNALEAGIVLAGISAGAICWFEQGVTDSMGGRYSALNCLGFLPGSCSPHYDGEADRRPAYHQMIAQGQIQPGIALDDGCAAHFTNGRLKQLVASRPEAKGYRLALDHGKVVETPLVTLKI